MTIRVEGVSVRAGGRLLVDDVSLAVPDGEVVGLVGPNGSGKSTVLKTIYAGRRRETGTVTVSGLDVDRTPARMLARRLAVVAQDGTTDFPMTVRSMVSLGRLPHRRGWASASNVDRHAVDDALHRAGVGHLCTRMLSTLSGGERQRVLLARALAQQSDHLLLDEPTNHLDIRAQLELLGLVRGLAVTTLVVLHDLNLAASHCDRLYVLAAGRIVAHGHPADVVSPQLAAAFFGVRAVLAPPGSLGAPQLLYPPIRHHPTGDQPDVTSHYATRPERRTARAVSHRMR